MKFTAERLKQYTVAVFTKMGYSETDALQIAEVLVAADLRGVESHGMARLPGYVRLWKAGRIKINANIHVVHETPSTALIDADNAVGLVAGPKAMRLAIEKAKTCGTGWVAVNNSNHFGIAGYHSMLAVKEDMIGFSFTNASPVVAPTFSKEGIYGTNPISFAVPTDKQPPMVVDMATSVSHSGKMEVALRKGTDIPNGWLQTVDGKWTTDPKEFTKGGTLLPLGGDYVHGSHKGYCLAAMVETLSGVLSGANFGPWVPPFVAHKEVPKESVGKGIGHFFGAMRVDAFRPAQEFKKDMDKMIGSLRNAKTVEGHEKVLVPGDPERFSTEDKLKNGIELYSKVVENMQAVLDELQIDFDLTK